MIIYKVTNNINGKVYIGQTTQILENRKYEHMYAAKTNKYEKLTKDYFHKALNKYGEDNFIWKVLEYCGSKEDLDLAEEWYIRYYKSYVGFDNSIGYNLTMGGNGNSGIIFSEEHRKKISESKKGMKLSIDTIEKIKNNAKINPNFGMRGKKCSEETKNKLRLINTGKKLSEETKNKLSKIHKGNKYNLGRKHSEESKLKMSLRTSGKLNPMYGIPSPMTGKVGCLNNQSKKYVIITPENKEIIVQGLYNFCINNKVKLYHSALIKVAKGKQTQHKGYRCRYFDENTDLNLPIWRPES